MNSTLEESKTESVKIRPRSVKFKFPPNKSAAGKAGWEDTFNDKMHLNIPPNPKFATIRTEAGVCGGEPIIFGTRITVRTLYSLHLQGESQKGLMKAFDLLDWEVEAALEYANRHKEEIMRLIEENADA